MGRILIHGGERQEHDLSDVVFLLATGGHNSYRGGLGGSFPVATAIHPGSGAIDRDVPAAAYGIKLIFTGRACAFHLTRWACTDCASQGTITGWESTDWDLS